MKTIIPFLFLQLSVHFVLAQYTNIQIDANDNPTEPSIAINPKNTSQLVAGSNIDNIYYSANGGISWTNFILNSSYGVWGDPCILADTMNNFYFTHLSNTNTPTGWIDRIVTQKSSDAGATWNNGTYTGLNGSKDQDKSWTVFDRSALSAFKGNIYVTWTEFDDYGSFDLDMRSRIMFSKSEDLTETWSAPIAISEFEGDCIDSDHTAEGAVPCVGPNGQVYVVWSLNDTLYFDKSFDGGETWLDNDLIVATQPGGWDYTIAGHDRCNGLPIAQCDCSGGVNNGTIYINWSDQRNGTSDTDVWISKSTDGGTTWSPEVRVNDDAPGSQNYLSWMTIDQSTGFIYVLFYDRRNYNDNNTDVYMAYSTDGGETFTNVLISETPFTPLDTEFFGDYLNITAHNGAVRPIWARMDNANTSIWTAIVDFPIGIEAPNHFQTQLKNYPNPFQQNTTVSFNTAVSQSLSMSIYDVFGKRIMNVFDKKQFNSGAHSMELNLSGQGFANGIYIVKLDNGAHAEQIRLNVAGQ
jgi:hypothetical protein